MKSKFTKSKVKVRNGNKEVDGIFETTTYSADRGDGSLKQRLEGREAFMKEIAVTSSEASRPVPYEIEIRLQDFEDLISETTGLHVFSKSHNIVLPTDTIEIDGKEKWAGIHAGQGSRLYWAMKLELRTKQVRSACEAGQYRNALEAFERAHQAYLILVLDSLEGDVIRGQRQRLLQKGAPAKSEEQRAYACNRMSIHIESGLSMTKASEVVSTEYLRKFKQPISPKTIQRYWKK